MRARILTVASVLLGVQLLSSANAEDAVTVSYQEPLEQMQFGYAPAAGEQKPGLALARSLRFNAFGRRFDINLEDNRSLLGADQRALLGDRYQIYRGDIDGLANSWARLVIADGLPRGMLFDGAELWAIDVEGNSSTGQDKPFMYRLSDLQIAPGTMSCAGMSAVETGAELAKAVMSEVTANAAQGPGAVSEINIAVIADFEFTSDKGANTNAELLARMNNVDGIFSSQLGVQMNVNRIDTFAADDDPFTTLDSGELLDELSEYRSNTAEQNANGLSHLFTGRNLDTNTVGIAWTGALCHPYFGASLTQATHNVPTDSLIAAHEFGHNFGAPHDGTSGSECESETGDFLMATSINGSDEFSSCSISQVQDDIAQASAGASACITPLPGTDVEVFGGSQSAPVLLGDSATVTFDTNSIGTDDASGVNIVVAVPAGITLDSVSATSGTCSSGAGTASCALGTITAGSGSTVTLTAATSVVGRFDFDATVTADSDANSNNNQATVQLNVDPAVDLVATASAAAQVTLNTSTTIRPRVRNSSSIAATNVTVTVTPNGGIDIDSASWPEGSCDIANNVATCDAGSLPARSDSTLEIGITGRSEGDRSYAVSVGASETDRNGSNNDVSGQVTVGAAVTVSQSNSGGSGGGSLGWLSLLFLMLVARRRLTVS